VAATVKNTGDAAVDGLDIKASVPRRLASRPRAARVVDLAPGTSARRTLIIPVKRSAKAGSKLRLRVTVSRGKKVLASRSRVIRIQR
jgi:hypothetical protein